MEAAGIEPANDSDRGQLVTARWPANANRPDHVVRCRRYRDLRQDGEKFYNGFCDSCRQKRAAARRSATGARLLELAKNAGTVERDGQTFSVVVLPPKRRRRR
jgi:hypothetical protein